MKDKQEAYIEEKDIIDRYTVLFHDASPFMIPQLIRKLINELRRR